MNTNNNSTNSTMTVELQNEGGESMECANKAYWAFVIEIRKLQCAFDNAYDILDTETLRIHMDAINKAFNELEDE